VIETAQPGLLLTLAAFVFVVGFLVFIHEMGHYLVGRLLGVKADAFSIGFGKELFGWTDRQGTRWKVSALPLGGYVKFSGDMNPASQPSDDWLAMPAEERARTFQAKRLWQRACIVAAGPVTNFLFAILVFAAFFAAYGVPRTPAVVSQVLPGSAAAAAGLQPGDRVTAMLGRSVNKFEDIVRIAQIHPGERVVMTVERGGGVLDLPVILGVDEQVDRFGNRYRVGRLGVAGGERVIEKLPAGEVLFAAAEFTWDMTRSMVSTLEQIITGRRSVTELGGPIKIAQFAGQMASLGLVDLVSFMAFISINLGFINLLPIPMLDGGHLLFYALEGLRRRPVAAKTQEYAFMSGLALLATFMLFVTFNDLASFGLWEKLVSLGR
jgi:regulator of sigma E protease